MTALTITIPKALWLTSNRHAINRGHRATIVSTLHGLTIAAAVQAHFKPVSTPVAVDWTIRYPKGVRLDKGDPTNAQPTTKACLDALVPRWLVDDGPLHVVSETFRRGPNLDVPSVHEITLTLTATDRTAA